MAIYSGSGGSIKVGTDVLAELNHTASIKNLIRSKPQTWHQALKRLWPARLHGQDHVIVFGQMMIQHKVH